MSVKLIKTSAGETGVLTVPAALMRTGLVEGMRFSPEFTPDGILFRFVGFEAKPSPASAPAWARTTA